MSTRETIEAYFSSLRRKDGWQNYFADDLEVASRVSLMKQVSGRAAFLEATKGFYRMIVSFDTGSFIVESERACVTTRYQLQPPSGPIFVSDVAELFVVRDGRIASVEIYFDPTPYPR